MQKLMSGAFAAALVLALPLTANAQEAEAPEGETPEVCTATIAPVHAGEKIAAKATFAEPFGQIVAIETSAESGLALVTEKDRGERAGMAAEAKKDAEEPVEMAGEAEAEAEAAIEAENASTFWLNAKDATAGTYEITLKNEAGESCATEITVEEKASVENEDGEEY